MLPNSIERLHIVAVEDEAYLTLSVSPVKVALTRLPALPRAAGRPSADGGGAGEL